MDGMGLGAGNSLLFCFQHGGSVFLNIFLHLSFNNILSQLTRMSTVHRVHTHNTTLKYSIFRRKDFHVARIYGLGLVSSVHCVCGRRDPGSAGHWGMLFAWRAINSCNAHWTHCTCAACKLLRLRMGWYGLSMSICVAGQVRRIISRLNPG